MALRVYFQTRSRPPCRPPRTGAVSFRNHRASFSGSYSRHYAAFPGACSNRLVATTRKQPANGLQTNGQIAILLFKELL